MPPVLRFVRGNPQIIQLPKLSTDQIEMGDLLYWDATNNVVRNAETVSGADYATKKANFAAAFVGVAMSSHDANTTGNVLVATDGEFVYTCPTGAEYDVGDQITVGDGTAVADQTVVKTSTSTERIARVVQLKPSTQATVVVRIQPVFIR